MELFTLAAKITADTSDFEKSVSNADKSGKSLANGLEGAFGKVKKIIAVAASAVAVKKITQGLFSAAAATAQMGDQIDKQSQALGMSRKAYQEWDYILSQNGASIESMGTSMKTLNNAITSGGKEMNAAFKELGLSSRELASLSQEGAFEEVVGAFQRLPAGAQKSALAVKLFGRNGQDLLPLLNSSAGSVEELREQAEKLGLFMSDDAVDASVKYSDALDTMKRTFTGLKNILGAQLLPAFTRGFQIITNYAGRLGGYIKTAIETGDWRGLFNNVIGDVKDAANRIWLGITDTIPTIWENAQESLLSSDSVILQTVGSLMSAISEAVQYISDNKQAFIEAFDEISSAIGGIVTTGIETVKSVFEWLNEHGVDTKDAIKGIMAAFAVVKIIAVAAHMNKFQLTLDLIVAAAALIIANWDGIVDFFRDLWESISQDVSEAWDKFKNWIGDIYASLSSAWGDVTEFFTEIWGAVSTAISGAWDAFSAWIDNNILSSIKDAWSGVSDFFTGLWGKVASAVNGAIEAVRTFLGLNDTGGNGGSGGPVWEGSNGEYGPAASNSWQADPLIQNLTDAQMRQYGLVGYKAAGQNYVPYDDYIARLHRGEMVLNRSRADEYRSGNSGSFSAELAAFEQRMLSAVRAGMEAANISMNLDGVEVARNTNRRMANDIKARRFAAT